MLVVSQWTRGFLGLCVFLDRILVPLRLSPAGAAKLPVAERQARAFDAELLLLHVEPDTAGAEAGGVPPGMARARAYLDTVTASLRGAGLRAQPLVRVGPVADVVLDSARRFSADLIILGVTVQSRLLRVFSEGIAGEVSRRAPCAVLLVPPDEPVAADAPPVQDFGAAVARAGAVSTRSLGIRSVEVTRIVGSVGRTASLRRNFRARRSDGVEQTRQVRVEKAMVQGDSLPAVQLYKLGYGYYVFDGHHRVAGARQLGQLWIDADVTEYVPTDDGGAQRLAAARRAFELNTDVTRVGASLWETYGRLRERIHEYASEHALPDLRTAASHWYAKEFRPAQLRLMADRLCEYFPGERTADIFVRVGDRRRAESEQRGQECSWTEALDRFREASTSPRRSPPA